MNKDLEAKAFMHLLLIELTFGWKAKEVATKYIILIEKPTIFVVSLKFPKSKNIDNP